MAAWTDSAQPEDRGRPRRYTDMAITTHPDDAARVPSFAPGFDGLG
ncbi:hypothetical protein B6E78_15935 [Edwardsiella ictaluri]|nr:hypothetical protein B6E78_15935 [Edwardsiella ictaluri]